MPKSHHILKHEIKSMTHFNITIESLHMKDAALEETLAEHQELLNVELDRLAKSNATVTEQSHRIVTILRFEVDN